MSDGNNSNLVRILIYYGASEPLELTMLNAEGLRLCDDFSKGVLRAQEYAIIGEPADTIAIRLASIVALKCENLVRDDAE